MSKIAPRPPPPPRPAQAVASTLSKPAESLLTAGLKLAGGDFFELPVRALAHGLVAMMKDGPVVFGKNTNAVGDAVMPSRSGPIGAEAWKNPVEIVGNLRQNTTPDDVNGDDRCGPTNLLAGALLNGQATAAKFLEKEAGSARLTPDQQKELKQIAADVRSGKASYDQLTTATDLLYKASNTRLPLGEAIDSAKRRLPANDTARFTELMDKAPNWSAAELKEASGLLTRASGKDSTIVLAADPRGPSKKALFVEVKGDRLGDGSGLDDGELQAHAKAGGLNAKSVVIDQDKDSPLGHALAQLKPGETTVVRLGLGNEDETPNHYVTIGKLPDGRPYVYNPNPGPGDATLVVGNKRGQQPPELAAALSNLDFRMSDDADGKTPRSLKVKY